MEAFAQGALTDATRYDAIADAKVTEGGKLITVTLAHRAVAFCPHVSRVD